jgi:hypothetical protein
MVATKSRLVLREKVRQGEMLDKRKKITQKTGSGLRMMVANSS